MASILPVTQSKSIWKEPISSISPKNKATFLSIPNSTFAQNLNLYSRNQSSSSISPYNKALLSIPKSSFDQSLNLFSRNQPSFSILPKNKALLQIPNSGFDQNLKLFSRNQPYLSKMVLVGSSSASSAATSEKSNKRYPGEAKGFVEDMRYVAMKLHTKDQAKEGQKEPRGKPLAKWEPSVEGYLKFLVDSKLVYDTLEGIMDKAAFPEYAEFKNTGLERSECLAKDLEWFKEQGNTIPEPSSPGVNYAKYLEDISQTDPQAFICHFYNTYFAHTAGGRMIGRKVAQTILNNKELEFYKWEGDLSQLLQNVRDQINQVAENWTREDKDHCLEETEKSFKFSGEILRLILI